MALTIPKKLRKELVCKFCKCSFIPIKDEEYCQTCTRLGNRLEEDKKVVAFKTKICRSCEKEFVPASGNDQTCPSCREKEAKTGGDLND